jgi:hypothetical protein
VPFYFSICSVTPERKANRHYKMGKSQYNFGKNVKEKARQLKQTEKTAKRLAAKKQKAEMANTANKESEIAAQVTDDGR